MTPWLRTLAGLVEDTGSGSSTSMGLQTPVILVPEDPYRLWTLTVYSFMHAGKTCIPIKHK